MTQKIYPGMLDARIEYFAQDGIVFEISNGTVKEFNKKAAHPQLENFLQSEPLIKETLAKMCDGDQPEMLRTLAHCRFGGLNFEADFDEYGNSNHDYIDCPLRGNCIGDGIVCQSPEINGHAISKMELTILRACATDRKNTAIASDLNMREGTFNVTKNKIYKSVGVLTKQHLALTLVHKGLL